MATNSVSFFQPGSEQAIDLRQLQRQRDMAEMLTKQGRTPQEGQMVNGRFIAPGAGAYVSQLASALFGNMATRRADEQEREFGERLRASRTKEASEFMGALNGSPGRVIQPLTPNDDEGNPMPVAQGATVPPDRAKALALALQSQNPQLQAMGGDLMKRQLDAAELQEALRAANIGVPGGGAPADGAAPAAGGMPSGGVPPGVNPQALALMLSKNPQANKLGGVIQDLSKPQVLGEGGTLLERGPDGAFAPRYIAPKTEAGIAMGRGPNGLSAAPIPGFAEAKGQIAGAEASARQSAESANTMVTINTPEGPRMITRQQALGLAGGGPAQSPPAGLANPTERGMATNAALTDNPAASAQREIAALRNDLNKVPDARSKQMIQDEIIRLEGQLQKYPAPTAGAGRGGQGGPGIPLQSEAAKEYDTTRAKDFAKTASEVQEKGRGAGGMLRNLDALEQLYKDPNVAKGGMAESISSLKNMGASLGVETKGLGAEQAIEAITNKMALDARSTAEGGGMPGAMSDADRNFLKAQQPGLSKTPEGRAMIIDTARKVAMRQQQIAQMANEYERANGRLDAGFDRAVAEFANQNRMFADQKPPASAAPASQDFKALAAQELARRRAKNGS